MNSALDIRLTISNNECSRLTNSNACINMNKEQHDTEKDQAIKEAAKILGRIGGMAGRGDAKRRPSEVCRAAVLKRWAEYRKAKALSQEKQS